MTPTAYDIRFDGMGTHQRVAAEGPHPALGHRVRLARAEIEHTDEQLTRFDPTSTLSRLNAASAPVVAAGPLLRDHVQAALWAAQRSGGLVDPTLLDAIEDAGYRTSRAGLPAPDVAAAIAAAPARTAAAPATRGAWERVTVDQRSGTIARPPGVRLDLGGTAKGHAADRALNLLQGARYAIVDCGGDVAVGGTAGRQHAVLVEHPQTGETIATLRVLRGGVATSGMTRRAWLRDGGEWAHHLLDPSTGEPCWSGLLAATAVGASALEAEVLAKMAFLRGPEGARRLLRRRGGVIVHEDGDAEVITAAPMHTVRVRRPRDRWIVAR